MIGDDPQERLEIAPVPPGQVPWRIATQVAATAAIFGGVEGVAVATRSQLWLSAGERTQLTLGAVFIDAGVGLAAGLVGGLIAWAARPWEPTWVRHRRGFGVGWTLFAAFYLVPMLVELGRRGEWRHTFGLGLVSLSVAVFGFLVSGFVYRREAIGLTPRIGYRLPALAFALVLVGVSAAVPQRRRPPAFVAPPGSTNVVLITVDTLRRDHVGVYGGAAATPEMDRLGREGAIVELAVTPLPETAPSHAAMFTGRHPTETHVIQNGRTLASAELTVAEQLSLTGWRTGAFVSAFAVDSSTGLDQGFEVYDDDFAPAFRGLSEFRAGWLTLRLLMRFGDPADWGALLERRGDRTVARALDWLDTVPPTEPVFLWVHLFDPHSPYEPPGDTPIVDHKAILAQEPGYAYTPTERDVLRRQYAAEVEWTDQQVGVLMAGLRARGRLDEGAVLLLADHGESLGEHGIHFNHHGVYDDVLRVPMLLWQSRQAWEPGTRVTEQVHVQDVANTLVEAAGAPKLTKTTSVALQHRLRGSTIAPEPILLLGRTDRSWLYGVRAPAGVKYIQADDGTEELYDLAADPGELQNLVQSQPAAVRNGRSGVEVLKKQLDRTSGAPSGSTAAMLEQLGYTEPSEAP